MNTENSTLLSRVKTFDLPPADFDPHTADLKTLLKFGFPPRPDPGAEPQWAPLWRRAFAHAEKLNVIKAKIELVPSRNQPDTGIRQTWSGAIVQAGIPSDRTAQANKIYAEWRIPEFTPDLSPGIAESVGVWIGLNGDGELLQAGTAYDPNRGCYAFIEWYTAAYRNPEIVVSNFVVSPGDYVSVLLYRSLPDQGFASFLNSTSQQATSIGVPRDPRLPGASTVGENAVWIVESQPPSDVLPEFSAVDFMNCTAATPTRSFNLEPNGGPINITDNEGNALTNAFIINANFVMVVWKAWT